ASANGSFRRSSRRWRLRRAGHDTTTPATGAGVTRFQVCAEAVRLRLGIAVAAAASSTATVVTRAAMMAPPPAVERKAIAAALVVVAVLAVALGTLVVRL